MIDTTRTKLNLGCGNFQEEFADWLNVDTSAKLAAQYPKGAFYLCDYTKVDKLLKPESMEVVFSEHSFEHLNMRQAAIAMEGIYKVLHTEGGVIRIVVPDAIFRQDEPPEKFPDQHGHVTAWSQYSLSWLLEGAGFVVSVVQAWQPDGGQYIAQDLLEMDLGHIKRTNSLIVDGTK